MNTTDALACASTAVLPVDAARSVTGLVLARIVEVCSPLRHDIARSSGYWPERNQRSLKARFI